MSDDLEAERALDPGDLTLRLQRPCRIVRVRRSARGYDILGQSLDRDGKSSVRWRVRSFSFETYGDDRARTEADAFAWEFARRLPVWFNGYAYYVDSNGHVTLDASVQEDLDEDP